MTEPRKHPFLTVVIASRAKGSTWAVQHDQGIVFALSQKEGIGMAHVAHVALEKAYPREEGWAHYVQVQPVASETLSLLVEYALCPSE